MKTVKGHEFLELQELSKFPHTGPVHYFGRMPYGAAFKGKLLYGKAGKTRWFRTEAAAIAAINKAAKSEA